MVPADIEAPVHVVSGGEPPVGLQSYGIVVIDLVA